MLTQERVKELLDYNPDTGVFTWRVSNGRRAIAGAVAGCLNPRGYRVIKIEGIEYKAHRLAWLYVYGHFPTRMIDHINADQNPEAVNRADNRIANLRDVDNRGNQSNTYKHRSGYLVGTKLDKRRGTWSASIIVDRVRTYLGTFLTQQEASDTYQLALQYLVPEGS